LRPYLRRLEATTTTEIFRTMSASGFDLGLVFLPLLINRSCADVEMRKDADATKSDGGRISLTSQIPPSQLNSFLTSRRICSGILCLQLERLFRSRGGIKQARQTRAANHLA
jgi:hypothetical protein